MNELMMELELEWSWSWSGVGMELELKDMIMEVKWRTIPEDSIL
jgi:hypothetical protein